LKAEEIKALFGQFEQAAAQLEGVECWSARDMQTLLGYTKWENFEKVGTCWYEALAMSASYQQEIRRAKHN
jgi:hypothetical protein